VPELPEVETVVRTLRPRLAGRRILEARFLSPLILRGEPEPPVAGRAVLGVRRTGKLILIDLEGGALAVHLGMTGRLLFNSEPTPHMRAWFGLDSGTLVYDDVRQFGRLSWTEGCAGLPARLGPDALDLSPAEFVNLLRGRRGSVKPLLLNQAFISGLGNIYTDEALYRAGVHPLAKAGRLSAARRRRLHSAIVEVLLESIEHGGSSISDYTDAEGRSGSFQRLHRVYARQGRPCPQCGSLIRRILVAQRGTHYCPRCQRL
jgi:formamidopyrimidine-DNA glycosylase